MNNVFSIGTSGVNLAVSLFILGILAFLFQTFKNNKGYNLIMLIITLEIILLSISILLVNYSIGLDDYLGINISLFMLAIAGSESAIGLALLIAYFPIRS